MKGGVSMEKEIKQLEQELQQATKELTRKPRAFDAGCHEMTIFLRGDHLFLYALIDKIKEFTATRERDPSFQKWNAWMTELLEHPNAEEESSPFARLKEIWRFEADGDSLLTNTHD
jgi:L-rhamnose mutarotase